jgi:hypothetical protein
MTTLQSCNSSVRIDGTYGCQGSDPNSAIIIPPATPDSIVVFDDATHIKATQTHVDLNGNVYEGTGLFQVAYPNDPFVNITHNRIFFESVVTVVANTAPIPTTGSDLNYCDIDGFFFNTGNTLRAYMCGQMQSGVNPFTYGLFFYIYDVRIDLTNISGPALLALTPYEYNVYVTFRDLTTVYYMVKFEYLDSVTNAMKTFMVRGGPVTIDQASALHTVKITCNTALAGPDASNNVYSDQCQFSYS